MREELSTHSYNLLDTLPGVSLEKPAEPEDIKSRILLGEIRLDQIWMCGKKSQDEIVRWCGLPELVKQSRIKNLFEDLSPGEKLLILKVIDGALVGSMIEALADTIGVDQEPLNALGDKAGAMLTTLLKDPES